MASNQDFSDLKKDVVSTFETQQRTLNSSFNASKGSLQQIVKWYMKQKKKSLVDNEGWLGDWPPTAFFFSFKDL